MASSSEHTVGIHSIVPVIKVSQPGEEPADITVPAGDGNTPVFEDLVGDLLVCYAFDVADQYILLQQRHLGELGLAQADLRKIAVSNFADQLADIQRSKHPELPVYALVGHGNLESSLLLIEDFWESQRTLVSGELVVAVPARDCIAFTDSKSPDGLAELSAMFDRLDGATHRLTRRLLVWRQRRWQLFEGCENEEYSIVRNAAASANTGNPREEEPRSSDLPFIAPQYRPLIALVGGAISGLFITAIVGFEQSLGRALGFFFATAAVSYALWVVLEPKKK